MCYQNNLLMSVLCFFGETVVSSRTVGGSEQTLILTLNKHPMYSLSYNDSLLDF